MRVLCVARALLTEDTRSLQTAHAQHTTEKYLLRGVRSLVVLVCTLFGLSPVLKTLVESVSNDTIWALTIFFFVLHLAFADYSYLQGNAERYTYFFYIYYIIVIYIYISFLQILVIVTFTLTQISGGQDERSGVPECGDLRVSAPGVAPVGQHAGLHPALLRRADLRSLSHDTPSRQGTCLPSLIT
jgi:hypothetical protein